MIHDPNAPCFDRDVLRARDEWIALCLDSEAAAETRRRAWKHRTGGGRPCRVCWHTMEWHYRLQEYQCHGCGHAEGRGAGRPR